MVYDPSGVATPRLKTTIRRSSTFSRAQCSAKHAFLQSTFASANLGLIFGLFEEKQPGIKQVPRFVYCLPFIRVLVFTLMIEILRGFCR